MCAKRKTLLERFNEKWCPEPFSGCWLWTAAATVHGYGHFYDGNGKIVKAAKFSWELRHGPVARGVMILHACDTPLCINPAHLFLGTQRDNMRDCAKKKRFRERGKKLTAKEIREIRLPSTEVVAGIAKRYGITRNYVDSIRRRVTWKDLR